MPASPGSRNAAALRHDSWGGRRLLQDGPNALALSPQRTLLRLFAGIVTEPRFLLLVVCGFIYLQWGDRGEALMLLGFVFVVMGIMFSRQRRAENALAALAALPDLSSPTALMVRDGVVLTIAASALVCGDLVLT